MPKKGPPKIIFSFHKITQFREVQRTRRQQSNSKMEMLNKATFNKEKGKKIEKEEGRKKKHPK